MSEPQDDVIVEEDGVSIRKTLNDHQFETLAVVFDIRAGREHAADVSVTDTIPDGVVEDDVGFHPEYGGEHWRAGDGVVTFGRTFAPGEQYTTVYGVRDFDGDRASLLDEPVVAVGPAGVDGVSGIDDLVSEDDSDVVREVIAGDRDTLPGLEESDDADGTDDQVDADGPAVADAGAGGGEIADAGPATGVPDESVGDDDGPSEVEAAGPDAVEDDVDGAVPSAEPATDDGSADAGPPDERSTVEGGVTGDGDAVDEGPADEDDNEPEHAETAEGAEAVTVPVTGGIARVLAKELRAGNVSYGDRQLLREELLPDDGSTDARIKRLQTQMADLLAYADALEAFLDEEGGAEAVLGRVEEDVAALTADLRTVEATVDSVEGSLDDVEGDVDDLGTDVGDLGEDVGDLEEDVEHVEGGLDRVSSDVDDVAGAVDDVEDTVGRVERDVESVEEELERLESVDRRVGRVEDDIAAIHDQLADLATFRDRLSSVFGTGEGGGDVGTSGQEQGDDEDGDDRDRDVQESDDAH